MACGLMELPTFERWRLAVDMRVLLAAGVPVGIEAQVGIFDKTRLQIYLASLVLSAVAGIAYQLRIRPVTFVGCIASMLNCGLLGLSVTLFGMSTWAALYPEALVGGSIFLGLGGMRTLEAVEVSGADVIMSLPKVIAQWVLSRNSSGKPGAGDPPP